MLRAETRRQLLLLLLRIWLLLLLLLLLRLGCVCILHMHHSMCRRLLVGCLHAVGCVGLC